MNSPKSFDFYLLRSPLYPSKVLSQVNRLCTYLELGNYVSKFFDNPIALNALYFASSEVYEQFVNLKNENEYWKNEKLLLTLYKYICRMSSRPTPFGLLSGICCGDINSNKTHLLLSGEINTHIRYDEEFILKFSDILACQPEIKENIIFYTNTSISIKNNTITYIEFIDEENNRHFQWRRIQLNPLLTSVLECCEGGKNYNNIIGRLILLGVSKDKAENYINELISLKLLISDLEPVLTKEDSNRVLSKLKRYAFPSGSSPILFKLEDNIKLLTNLRKFYDMSDIRYQTENLLKFTVKNIFQVDSQILAISNHIEDSIVNQISKEIDEILVLNNNKEADDLKLFKSSFKKKYGEREIPLIDALDPEIGIGYGKPNNDLEELCPLLKGIINQQPHIRKEHLNNFVENIIEKNTIDKRTVARNIELNEIDLKPLMNGTQNINKNYPLTYSVLGNLLLEKQGEINKDNFKFNLLKAGGNSALQLMTRFSHLDNKLNSKQKTIAAFEEDQSNNKILAEIVFLPNRRAGNILTRPAHYQYEIPIITQGAVDSSHIIYLKDLYVKVRNDQIILTSHKLQKEIIPRLSSAHNFTYGMVIYRFLCDLQSQHSHMNVYWDWGALSTQRYLPRVTYKHLILSRAKWNLKQQKYNKIDNEAAIKAIKEDYNLPNRLLLIEGDNELLLDLCCPFGVEIFLKELAKKDISVCEFIYDSFDSALKDKNGDSFYNEILIPYKGDQLTTNTLILESPDFSIKREFPLGSEWLYIKLYSSERISDSLLESSIKNLVFELLNEKLIKKWFFVRYNDPDPHLRIRFNLNVENNHALQETIRYINKHIETYVSQNKVSKVLYDTYERELERYGFSNIENCESIFYLQSVLVVELLPFFKTEFGKNLRWLTAMKIIDEILTAFKLNLMEKIKLIEKIRDQFLVEFKNYKNLKFLLDKNYRENRKLILDFFHNQETSFADLNSLILKHKILISEHYLKCQSNVEYRIKKNEIVASLVHMFLNRIFSMKQREQEMAIYHFLLKFLISESKKNNPI
ncbi:MAG: thiopeptide-type bacteriocin biosynthesis domain [Sphingobacterium sp.]|nr:thiopeptide-type bacteriocin biosynthesis domain [Sphingobacterium sp.]